MIRAGLLLALLPGLAPGAAFAAPCAPATVVLLRHAEKAALDGERDPPLSEAGQRRAQALVGWFEGRPLDAIYATHLRRTQHTAAPLAAARGLELRVLPAADEAGLVARLRTRHCGEHVAAVGHSNTVPGIAAALGAAPFEIGEDEYGALYLVEPASGTLRRDAFGGPAD